MCAAAVWWLHRSSNHDLITTKRAPVHDAIKKLFSGFVHLIGHAGSSRACHVSPGGTGMPRYIRYPTHPPFHGINLCRKQPVIGWLRSWGTHLLDLLVHPHFWISRLQTHPTSTAILVEPHRRGKYYLLYTVVNWHHHHHHQHQHHHHHLHLHLHTHPHPHFCNGQSHIFDPTNSVMKISIFAGSFACFAAFSPDPNLPGGPSSSPTTKSWFLPSRLKLSPSSWNRSPGPFFTIQL